jgi:hypothetical protein
VDAPITITSTQQGDIGWTITLNHPIGPRQAYVLKDSLFLPDVAGFGGIAYPAKKDAPKGWVNERAEPRSGDRADVARFIDDVSDERILIATEAYPNAGDAVRARRNQLCKQKIGATRKSLDAPPPRFCAALREYCTVVRSCKSDATECLNLNAASHCF